MTVGRRLAALKRALEAQSEDVMSCARRLLEEPTGPLVLAGVVLQRREVTLLRVASLAMRDANHEDAWTGWALLLMPPYHQDLTTNLNVLSGVCSREVWRDPASAPILSSLLVGFVDHALSMPPIIAERTIDTLGAVPPVALDAFDASRLQDIARRASSVIDAVEEVEIREDLQGSIDTALGAHSPPRPILARSVQVLRARLPIEPGSTEASQLAADASEFLDAYLATVPFGPTPRVLQRVRVISTSRRRPLDDTRIWPAASAWGRFFRDGMLRNSNLDVQMRPAGARPGSFVVDQLVEEQQPPTSILKASDNLFGVLDDTEKVAPAAWRALLDVLSSNDLAVEVRHYWGTTKVAPLKLSRQSIRARRSAIGRAPSSHVESSDVPQADRLEKVFRVVDVVSDGNALSPESLEVVGRQVNYYKRAAKILGLLEEDDTLAAAGRHFTRLNTEDRMRSAAVLFESCAVGEAWISWFGGTTLLDVDPTSAEAFLRERTLGLSGDTPHRRARTLESWWASLTPFHYSREAK